MPLPPIEVAVAVVSAPDGRVLMAQRTATQVAPGYWELPGGKVDPGETPEQAAVRELHEETGLHAQELRPWACYVHAYRTRRVRLWFFRVPQWQGSAQGREGQQIAWVDPAAPQVAPIMPSVERVLFGLALPSLGALVHIDAADAAAAVERQLELALARGLRWFVVQAPTLLPEQRSTLARRLTTLAQAYDARAVPSGTVIEARRAGAAVLHSPAKDIPHLVVRPQVKFWIASCRDGADCARAIALGADAILVDTAATADHGSRASDSPWDALRAIAHQAPLPVYLAGAYPRVCLDETLTQAQRAGAAGVATSVWRH